MSLSKYKIPGLDIEFNVIFYNKKFYFIGREIAKTLGYKDIKKALQRVDDEDKIPIGELFQKSNKDEIISRGTFGRPGNRFPGLQNWPDLQPHQKLITEIGFYNLAFGSILPMAKPFRRKVCELLQTIREKGLTIEGCIKTLNLLEDTSTTEKFSVPDFVFSQQEELEDLDTLRNLVIEEYLKTKEIKNNDTVSKLKFYKEHKKKLREIIKDQNLLPEDDI